MPKATREQVLSEFNHQCAICGQPKPQLHHIDEDHDNHDPLNLLPLCPNHHLIDQHDPTRTMEPERLKLFRVYKDPVILWPQFQPLYMRMKFFDDEEIDFATIAARVGELCEFVAMLEMGSFYAKKIREAVDMPSQSMGAVSGSARQIAEGMTRQRRALEERNDTFRVRLPELKVPVHALVVEMLRYQRWQKPETL